MSGKHFWVNRLIRYGNFNHTWVSNLVVDKNCSDRRWNIFRGSLLAVYVDCNSRSLGL